ncbi:hypothetical protein GBAR_LOCUS12947 [Geodia barretti]|uniref:Uncharacterized protein n=1 Tax=Geodia barretti TaxID=519541 RepID=A0AA35S3P0_GEOBA|nr:hypothetical protein GBAR_LOCUS12947 [Geodia barretti]
MEVMLFAHHYTTQNSYCQFLRECYPLHEIDGRQTDDTNSCYSEL